MFRMSPRDMKRMMKKMGIDVDIEDVPDAERVIVQRTSGVRYIIDSPQVTIMKMKGQTIIQVIGELREELEQAREEAVQIREEDIELVALEASVSLEEARRALEMTKGDLAQAILLLQSKKT